MLEHYFCGDKGGKPFSAVTRVDPTTRECPSETAPCSNSTSPENTVCYPLDQFERSCPVTQILFVKEDQIATYQSDTATYRIQEVEFGTEKEYFVTSKNSTDNLPITTTSVEGGNPCIHPGDISNQPFYYPLENDRLKSSCQYDDVLETSIDTRYNETGGWTTEWALQSDAGTIQVLTELPLYTQYMPNYVSQKKDNQYKMWTRPTITWKLECEEDKPRSSVLTTVGDTQGE